MIETAESGNGYRSKKMELNLELGIFCLPKPISEFLLQDAARTNDTSRLSEIHGYVDRLEDEKRKIDAFKRELPLCMLLLSEAIGRLKEEATRCSETRDGSTRKGSVASNRKFDEGGDTKVEKDKKSWMSSAQLWVSSTQLQSTNEEEGGEGEGEEEEEERSVTQIPLQNSNIGNRGGAFLPFMRPLGVGHHPPPPPLCLMTPPSVDRSKPHSQQQRKDQRRRWSPDLHRKFIDALQQLGGSQAATPKQIRELMQVEGLTNDEVKSHLQKYRIHVRKVTPSSAEAAAKAGVKDQKPAGNNVPDSQNVFWSDSPQGPLVGRGFSSNGGHSSGAAEEDEDDDENSDGHSWKGCN